MPFYAFSPPSTHLTHPNPALKELGFLKMLQESPRYIKSDDESSLCSESSQLQGILKSPFNKRRHSRRRVSFSFNDDVCDPVCDNEQSNMFSSDNESEAGHRVMDLLDIVDDSIRNDGAGGYTGGTARNNDPFSSSSVRTGNIVDSSVRTEVAGTAASEDTADGITVGVEGLLNLCGGVDVVEEFQTKKRKRLVSAEYDDNE